MFICHLVGLVVFCLFFSVYVFVGGLYLVCVCVYAHGCRQRVDLWLLPSLQSTYETRSFTEPGAWRLLLQLGQQTLGVLLSPFFSTGVIGI